MIEVKSGELSKKNKQTILDSILELPDYYRDFYITKNNLRLYIKENIHLLYDCLKEGDKIIFNEKGIVVIDGFSDKANRHYIKILSDNLKNTDKLIKVLLWHFRNIDLFTKVKKNNPVIKILKNNGWIFFGSRGREMLLLRKAQNLKEKTNVISSKN